MSITTLYAEELKAATRGRFAWFGAATILLAIGSLATVGTQDTWLDGYGIIAYGLVPMAFIAVTAVMIAAPRANRFVECVFTAPVERQDWFFAKILVLLTLAAAYYIALLPMMIIYVGHVGLPPLLRSFLFWTPGLLIVSIATGTLIGVLFIGRSLAAPAGASMGVLLAYASLIPLQELMVARGNGATLSGHVALISPAVLLKNTLGFALGVGSIPATTTSTWVVLLAITAGTFLLALWIFLRAQGVETWELKAGQKTVIAAAMIGLLIAPAILANTDYTKRAPPQNNAPAIRALYSRSGVSLAMVGSGDEQPTRCCSTILNREEDWPLGTDETAHRDLLLLLPVDADRRVTGFRASIAGEDGLLATAVTAALEQPAPQLESRHYPAGTGPAAEDGHHVVTGWVVRIPVALMPTKPWDIGGNHYPLTVSATYDVAGDGKPHRFEARAAVEAEVGPAIYEMGLAASLLPLLCMGAGILRWRRTR